MTVEHADLEILEREECLRLLGEEVVGRLGVVDLGQPLIRPVNFVLDDDVIVFRSAEGSKLSGGLGSEVCFEVDGVDRVARAGWSVVVEGVLEEVTLLSGKTALDHTRAVAAEPWAPGTQAHWLRLAPGRITGRRIRPAGQQATHRNDDALASPRTRVGTLARPVTAIRATASIGDAAQVLRAEDVPCVLVEGEPCLWLSRDDFLEALANGLAPGAPVRSVQGSEPSKVPPATRLVDAAALMLEHSASYVLVIDGEGAPAGFVSIRTALGIALREVEPAAWLVPPPHS